MAVYKVCGYIYSIQYSEIVLLIFRLSGIIHIFNNSRFAHPYASPSFPIGVYNCA
ncbi:hypothetical protein SDC9_193677 [bioreactor metagenome]|uniref:Uncharacterized protein n=1 Tax=bioreactor metagenome TaxID=1076179 RepID=A0A645I476_9ZZZZ